MQTHFTLAQLADPEIAGNSILETVSTGVLHGDVPDLCSAGRRVG